MNPNSLPWPTDPSGVTSDLRKYGVLVAQRLYDDKQLEVYLKALDILKEYATEQCEARKKNIAVRVAASAAASQRAALQQAEQRLYLAEARLTAVGDVTQAQADLEEARAAVAALKPQEVQEVQVEDKKKSGKK